MHEWGKDNVAVFPVYSFARHACSNVLLIGSRTTYIDGSSQFHDVALWHIATRVSVF